MNPVRGVYPAEGPVPKEHASRHSMLRMDHSQCMELLAMQSHEHPLGRRLVPLLLVVGRRHRRHRRGSQRPDLPILRAHRRLEQGGTS